MKKVVLDTNILIDWLNRGAREDLVIGPGLVRYLSATVAMELYAGTREGAARRSIDGIVRAHQAGGRLLAPPAGVILRAGGVLRQLKLAGFEVRSASLVNDVLIALTAGAMGCTLITANAKDFIAICQIARFALEIV